MNLTKRWVAAVAAALLTSCTPLQQSLDVLAVYEPPELTDPTKGCVVSATAPEVSLIAGSLNVGLGQSYGTIITMKNNLEVPPDTQPVTPNGNTANLTKMVLTYRTSGAGAGVMPSGETIPIALNSEAQSLETIFIGIIGPAGAEALATVPITPTRLDQFTLDVGIQFTGTLYSSAPIASNVFTFPITIYNAGGNPCVAPQIIKPAGPCGNYWQNGTPIVCCTPDPATGLCP